MLVHGGHARRVFAVLAEPALTDRYPLIHDLRRGWGNRSSEGLPLSIAQHAADCEAMLRHAGVESGASYAILEQKPAEAAEWLAAFFSRNPMD